MMKILILTQPLHSNYGGLLQAYALQKVLRQQGHEVYTEQREYPNDLRTRLSHNRFLRRIFGKTLYYYPTRKDRYVIEQHTRPFIEKHLQITPPVYSATKKELASYHFDAYVVGSDQIWRPRYSPNIYNYFLDFTHNQEVKRIAYAASFGVDDWEFDADQTILCKTLIQKFDAVSVREESGVALCREHFGVEAKHLLDPTMLLSAEDYLQLLPQESEESATPSIMTYVLDQTPEKQAMITTLSERYGLAPNYVMAKKNFIDVGRKHLKETIVPPVTDWIKGFRDACFVITDSFHGTVFAILFNKPFITVANSYRGISRFTSLLKMFGLEDRLIFSHYELTDELLEAKIDYDAVNLCISEKREEAIRFLKRYCC